MYTRICSNILFPLHERFKRHHSLRLLRELEQSQWLSGEELKALQVKRLRAFLINASQNVPYFQKVFKSSGFVPEKINSLSDLSALPFLTKQLIRENVDSLQSIKAGKLVRYNTGGSSGEPLVFYMGMGRVSHDVAAKWRATRWWGVDIGDPEVVLWGSPVELGKQDRVKAWRDRLFRSHLLPAFEMSVDKMNKYTAAIRDVRPRMLFGYASALAMLARHAESNRISLKDVGVSVVFTTGETLYPEQREVIERVFSAPVANGYGSRDAGFIAHQCSQGSLHQSSEHIIVELIDSNGKLVPIGERGEVVITHLATDDFPFVRYRTGDMAVASDIPCSCGRGLPVFREVLGRTTDFIYTPGGNAMHALALIYEVRDKPGVLAFKIIQAADYSLEVMLVTGRGFGQDAENAIREGIGKRMGKDSAIKFRYVDQILPEKSGKYRYVVSHASC
jgi:phenylacetate-CoA ligase